jgi:hypothetical protein
VSPLKITLPVAALVAALGASGAAMLHAPTATAQAAATTPNTPPPGGQGQPNRPPHQRFEPGRHLDGRIAFLKAELKITPQQEPQWDKVAQTMRENARETRTAFDQARGNRGQAQSAVARLEARQRFGTLHQQNAERFLAAFRPLYTSLSEDQKKSADELFSPHRHHFGRH